MFQEQIWKKKRYPKGNVHTDSDLSYRRRRRAYNYNEQYNIITTTNHFFFNFIFVFGNRHTVNNRYGVELCKIQFMTDDHNNDDTIFDNSSPGYYLIAIIIV